MLPLPQKSNSPPLLLHLIAGQLETDIKQMVQKTKKRTTSEGSLQFIDRVF